MRRRWRIGYRVYVLCRGLTKEGEKSSSSRKKQHNLKSTTKANFEREGFEAQSEIKKHCYNDLRICQVTTKNKEGVLFVGVYDFFSYFIFSQVKSGNKYWIRLLSEVWQLC